MGVAWGTASRWEADAIVGTAVTAFTGFGCNNTNESGSYNKCVRSFSERNFDICLNKNLYRLDFFKSNRFKLLI